MPSWQQSSDYVNADSLMPKVLFHPFPLLLPRYCCCGRVSEGEVWYGVCSGLSIIGLRGLGVVGPSVILLAGLLSLFGPSNRLPASRNQHST